MRVNNRPIAPGLIALLFLVFAAVMLVTAYSYSKASGLFPRFIGWIFLGLALLQVLIQLKTLVAAPSEDHEASTVARNSGQRLKGVKGFAWLAFMLAMIYFAGFFLATLVFVFTFLWISAGNSVAKSAFVAAITTGFVYVVFAKLLSYELYSGLLLQG
ncbi:MAG: tripartite tricarboxylate transporter TctB family protein [Woeseia sp.]